MNSVALNGVATNTSKSFGAKETSKNGVFDKILGKASNSKENLNKSELGHRDIKNIGKQQSKIIRQEFHRIVKDQMQEAQGTMQSELKTEYKQIEQTVSELTSEIAEELEISEEELSEIMAALNITTVDLFKNENLQAVINQVFGTSDEISILNDVQAVDAFKGIKLIVDSVLDKVIEDTGMDKESFLQKLTTILEQPDKKLKLEDVLELLKENGKKTVANENSNSEKTQANVIETSPEISAQANVKSSLTQTDTQSKETIENKPEITVEDSRTDSKQKQTNIFDNEAGHMGDKEQKNEQTDLKANNTLLGHFENVLSHTQGQKFQISNGSLLKEVVYTTNGAKEILTQLTTQIKLALTDESSTMMLQLQPENLGKVAFSVKDQAGIITGSIVAETQQVKEVIEQNLASLRANLDSQGIKLDEIKVVVGNTNQFFAKDEQERQSGYEKKSKKRNSLKGIDGEIEGFQQTHEQLRKTGLEEESSMVDYSA